MNSSGTNHPSGGEKSKFRKSDFVIKPKTDDGFSQIDSFKLTAHPARSQIEEGSSIMPPTQPQPGFHSSWPNSIGHRGSSQFFTNQPQLSTFPSQHQAFYHPSFQPPSNPQTFVSQSNVSQAGGFPQHPGLTNMNSSIRFAAATPNVSQGTGYASSFGTNNHVEFGEFSTLNSTQNVNQPVTPSPSDFGAFSSGSIPTSQAIRSEDFGNFSAAQAPDSSSSSYAPNLVDASSSDEFGSFSDFKSNTPSGTVSHNIIQATPGQSIPSSQTGASVPSQPVKSSLHAQDVLSSNLRDDEFGEFPDPVPTATQPATNQEDDGFEDFASFSPQQKTSAAADEEFGDFGSVAAPSVVNSDTLPAIPMPNMAGKRISIMVKGVSANNNKAPQQSTIKSKPSDQSANHLKSGSPSAQNKTYDAKPRKVDDSLISTLSHASSELSRPFTPPEAEVRDFNFLQEVVKNDSAHLSDPKWSPVVKRNDNFSFPDTPTKLNQMFPRCHPGGSRGMSQSGDDDEFNEFKSAAVSIDPGPSAPQSNETLQSDDNEFEEFKSAPPISEAIPEGMRVPPAESNSSGPPKVKSHAADWSAFSVLDELRSTETPDLGDFSVFSVAPEAPVNTSAKEHPVNIEDITSLGGNDPPDPFSPVKEPPSNEWADFKPVSDKPADSPAEFQAFQSPSVQLSNQSEFSAFKAAPDTANSDQSSFISFQSPPTQPTSSQTNFSKIKNSLSNSSSGQFGFADFQDSSSSTVQTEDEFAAFQHPAVPLPAKQINFAAFQSFSHNRHSETLSNVDIDADFQDFQTTNFSPKVSDVKIDSTDPLTKVVSDNSEFADFKQTDASGDKYNALSGFFDDTVGKNNTDSVAEITTSGTLIPKPDDSESNFGNFGAIKNQLPASGSFGSLDDVNKESTPQRLKKGFKEELDDDSDNWSGYQVRGAVIHEDTLSSDWSFKDEPGTIIPASSDLTGSQDNSAVEPSARTFKAPGLVRSDPITSTASPPISFDAPAANDDWDAFAPVRVSNEKSEQRDESSDWSNFGSVANKKNDDQKIASSKSRDHKTKTSEDEWEDFDTEIPVSRERPPSLTSHDWADPLSPPPLDSHWTNHTLDSSPHISIQPANPKQPDSKEKDKPINKEGSVEKEVDWMNGSKSPPLSSPTAFSPPPFSDNDFSPTKSISSTDVQWFAFEKPPSAVTPSPLDPHQEQINSFKTNSSEDDAEDHDDQSEQLSHKMDSPELYDSYSASDQKAANQMKVSESPAGFSSQPHLPLPSPLDNQSEDTSDEADDGWVEFGATVSSNQKTIVDEDMTTTEDQDEIDQRKPRFADLDWGDDDVIEPAPFTNDESFHQHSVSPPNFGPPETHEVFSDDEWDFKPPISPVSPASLDSANQRSPSVQSSSHTTPSLSNHSSRLQSPVNQVNSEQLSTNDNDSDFAAFGENTPPNEQIIVPAEDCKMQNKLDEDDFGDFGDFGATSNLPSTSQPSDDKPSSNPEEDDFGNFGAISTQPEAQAKSQDDFGDFGDANFQDFAPPSAAASTTATSQVSLNLDSMASVFDQAFTKSSISSSDEATSLADTRLTLTDSSIWKQLIFPNKEQSVGLDWSRSQTKTHLLRSLNIPNNSGLPLPSSSSILLPIKSVHNT